MVSAAAEKSPSTAMTSTASTPGNAPTASTIEYDIRLPFSDKRTNERRRGRVGARRSEVSPRGLAGSFEQRKEARRSQSGRREDHAPAQGRDGQREKRD